jgi:hypothetical protein
MRKPKKERLRLDYYVNSTLNSMMSGLLRGFTHLTPTPLPPKAGGEGKEKDRLKAGL